MTHKKLKTCMHASDTGELMGKKAVMGALTLYSRLYKSIYNVIKTFWSKKIILLIFSNLYLLTNFLRLLEFFNIFPLESVIKYFKLLLIGLKFLHILYIAFSEAFLKTLKPTCYA